MAKGIWIVGAAIILAGVAFFVWNGTPAEAPTTLQEEHARGVARVSLAAQNDSGETGFAELSDMEGDKTSVRIDLDGGPEDVAQPAHIHGGACPTPGAVKYPLSPVMRGVSETALDVPLVSLLTDLPLAVNVHKSAQEISVYVACGDIRVPQGETIEPVPIENAPPAASTPEMPPPSTVVTPSVVNVAVRNFAFAPAEVRVAPGTKVIWTNEDTVRHNAVADGGAFSGPLLSQGESYEFTYTAKGTYSYHCAPHPFMKATVVVE